MSTKYRACAAASAALALLLPGTAAAHTSEFLLAKVTTAAGSVTLDLTLDCSGHPAIESEAAAQALLARVLRVRVGAEPCDLGTLAPLHFERRTQIDAEAPIPRDPEEQGKPHRLVCATWTWRDAVGEVGFEVPADAGETLILWTPTPGESPRWVMLLPGEASPAVVIPTAPARHGPVQSAPLETESTTGHRFDPALRQRNQSPGGVDNVHPRAADVNARLSAILPSPVAPKFPWAATSTSLGAVLGISLPAVWAWRRKARR